VGDLTGKTAPALSLAERVTRRFAPWISRAFSPHAYFIGAISLLVGGGDTFIQDMLTHAGFNNISRSNPIPLHRLESLASSGCELVLLSSEPYPFRESISGRSGPFSKGQGSCWWTERFQLVRQRLLQAPPIFCRSRIAPPPISISIEPVFCLTGIPGLEYCHLLRKALFV